MSKSPKVVKLDAETDKLFYPLDESYHLFRNALWELSDCSGDKNAFTRRTFQKEAQIRDIQMEEDGGGEVSSDLYVPKAQWEATARQRDEARAQLEEARKEIEKLRSDFAILWNTLGRAGEEKVGIVRERDEARKALNQALLERDRFDVMWRGAAEARDLAMAKLNDQNILQSMQDRFR